MANVAGFLVNRQGRCVHFIADLATASVYPDAKHLLSAPLALVQIKDGDDFAPGIMSKDAGDSTKTIAERITAAEAALIANPSPTQPRDFGGIDAGVVNAGSLSATNKLVA